jgi:hypothetical protein
MNINKESKQSSTGCINRDDYDFSWVKRGDPDFCNTETPVTNSTQPFTQKYFGAFTDDENSTGDIRRNTDNGYTIRLTKKPAGTPWLVTQNSITLSHPQLLDLARFIGNAVRYGYIGK